MQRTIDSGVVISCDFCGTDWDPYDENGLPMIEGHKGSVICLRCVEDSLAGVQEAEGEYRCTMCIRDDIPESLPRWQHPSPTPSDGLNADATICRKCINQAAQRLHKDPDIDWTWEK